MIGFDAWCDERLPRYGGTDVEILTDCPWCGRPKLYVNPGKGLFFCQRCRQSGRGEQLVAKVDRVPIAEARSRLTPTPGDPSELLEMLLDATSKGASSTHDQVIPRHALPSEFTPCFDGEFWRVPDYATAPPPEGRGLKDSILVRHGLGFAVEGRYRDRLIVPIITGAHRTFLARLMGKPRDHRWTSSSGEVVEPPKYLTPRGAELSETLYWLDSLRPEGHVVIVEGVFDAIRLIDAGLPAVASFGKHLSRTQIRLLKAKRPRRVTLFRDAGAEADGWANARELRQRLARGTVIDVAMCPPGHDPDTLGYELGRRALRDALSRAAPLGAGVSDLEAALKSIL